MADQQNDQPESQEGEGGEGQQQQQGKSAADEFWARIDERLDAAIERGVKKHIRRQPSQTGTSRTGGRITIPGIIAEIMGGPFTPESKRSDK